MYSVFTFCTTLLCLMAHASTVHNQHKLSDQFEDTYDDYQNYVDENINVENLNEVYKQNVKHVDDGNKSNQQQVSNTVQNYEVTENFTEASEISTKLPIVTNFSIPSPLNNASTITNSFQNIVNNLNGLWSPTPKKNSFTIFHVNAEFENEKDDKEKQNAKEFVQNFREYLAGLRNGFVNGISNVFGRHLHFENHKNTETSYKKNA